MGPLIAERRVAWMEKLVEDATSKGARLVTGGRRIGNVGSYFEPTVLADVTEDVLAMNENRSVPLH